MLLGNRLKAALLLYQEVITEKTREHLGWVYDPTLIHLKNLEHLSR